MLDDIERTRVLLSYELEGTVWTRAWYFRDPAKALTFHYNLAENTPMPVGAANVEVTIDPDPSDKPPAREARAAGVALIREALSRVDGPLLKGISVAGIKTPMPQDRSKPRSAPDPLDTAPASTTPRNTPESSQSDALRGAEDLEDGWGPAGGLR